MASTTTLHHHAYRESGASWSSAAVGTAHAEYPGSAYAAATG
jgi:hypothetical protein